MKSFETKYIYGINFYSGSLDLAVKDVFSLTKKGCTINATTINLDYLSKANNNFKKIISYSDFLFADGMPIVWASKIAGRPLPGRVTGCDLGKMVINKCREEKLKVYLLATDSNGKKVAEIAAEKFRKNKVNIKGKTQDYKITKEYIIDNEIVEEIKNYKPDFLILGLGAPYQDKIILKYQELLDIPFCMGVGGSINIWAGLENRAPIWMRNIGLEWFWQLLKHPKKISRYFRSFLMLSSLLGWAVKTRLSRYKR